MESNLKIGDKKATGKYVYYAQLQWTISRNYIYYVYLNISWMIPTLQMLLQLL